MCCFRGQKELLLGWVHEGACEVANLSFVTWVVVTVVFAFH